MHSRGFTSAGESTPDLTGIAELSDRASFIGRTIRGVAVKDEVADQQDHRTYKAENALELTTHECIQDPASCNQ